MTYAAARKVADRAEDAIEARVCRHVPLVNRLAWHVHGSISSAIEREDLIQVGMVALVEAAQRFEDRGLDFAAYAALRVKGAMIDQLRRGANQTRAAAAARRRIEATRRTLERGGAHATPVALADAMGVSIEDYYRMEGEAAAGGTDSLETLAADKGFDVADDRQDQEFALITRSDEAHLREAIAMLDERSKTVLDLYFFQEMNLKEIGEVLGVSGPRVCQMKAAALATLAGLLKDDD